MSGGGVGEEESERLTEILRDLGVSDDGIRRAIERGDPEGAVLESALAPARAERTVRPAEVEAAGGLGTAEIAAIFQAMGLASPAPDDPALTPDEAEVFVELGRLRDIWPPELTHQAARMYGRLLARIARTAVQLFRVYAEPRVREVRGDSRADQLAALRDAFGRVMALPDPMLVGVHRRWLEYELAQTAVSAAERASPGALEGAVDVTLLFCDLKDFTAFANSEGDASAVEVIDAFARTVDSERGEQGRLVKALGDGHMLAYPEPGVAVEAGRRIIDGMRAHDMLGVHASVHRGTAILREGDYFGTAVNLAARLLGAAGRDELVATAAVASACAERFDWEPVGPRQVRGVEEPVELFRLRPGERA